MDNDDIAAHLEAHLWHWALETYGRGTVKHKLLALQDDFSLNVNILLWCCWTASAGRQVQRMEILNAVEIANHWSAQVTGPLRQARRGSRLMPAWLKAPTTEALYDDIKTVELAAEKIELVLLARLVTDAAMVRNMGEGTLADDALDIARRNVMAYLAEIGAARIDGFSVSPIEAYLEAVFASDDAQAADEQG